MSSSWLAPVTARAHADLDRAIASAEEAEFEKALSGFERALASGTLSRDELALLLTERALVLHAVGERGALAEDLATLALIDPGHDLGRRAPPELVTAFAEAAARQGAAVRIRASCAPSAAGLTVKARVTGLSNPSLARIRIRTRQGPGQDVVREGNEVELSVPDGASLRYSAELVGIGQVVLASDGSADDPKLCGSSGAGEASADADPERQDGKNRKLWWWLGAGGVVAISAVTVGLVVANQGGSKDNTSVGKPLVSFK